MTNFRHGIPDFGLPVLGVGPVMTTGNVFFVSSTTSGASDGNTGDIPETPFATIDAAINACTANNGDVIFAMPGHTESLLTAGQIAVDVAGVTVIGMGQGNTRPVLTYDAAAGSVIISASNVRWSNIVHEASFAEVVNGILCNNTIEQVEIDHCYFTYDASGIEFALMISLGAGATASADRVQIHDNWFEAEPIDGCASAIKIDDCDFVHIRNNLITGDFNSVAIDAAADTSACKGFIITDNVVYNLDTGFTIDLDDSATGFVANNVIFGGGASASNVDWGNCGACQNYVTEAADVHGIDVPITAQS